MKIFKFRRSRFREDVFRFVVRTRDGFLLNDCVYWYNYDTMRGKVFFTKQSKIKAVKSARNHLKVLVEQAAFKWYEKHKDDDSVWSMRFPEHVAIEIVCQSCKKTTPYTRITKRFCSAKCRSWWHRYYWYVKNAPPTPRM